MMPGQPSDKPADAAHWPCPPATSGCLVMFLGGVSTVARSAIRSDGPPHHHLLGPGFFPVLLFRRFCGMYVPKKQMLKADAEGSSQDPGPSFMTEFYDRDPGPGSLTEIGRPDRQLGSGAGNDDGPAALATRPFVYSKIADRQRRFSGAVPDGRSDPCRPARRRP